MDFESNQTHNITVRTTDDGGESFNQQLTINVTDVDETPTEPPILGGAGNDVLDGDSGNDVILGGRGDDQLNGGDGNDQLKGGAGNNLLNGGDGNDSLYGGADNDVLNGDDGNDLIIGWIGDDQLSGGNDDDLVTGGTGNDTLNGDDGNDTLNGGDDNDQLNGGTGNDTLNGHTGSDTLIGVDITSVQPGSNEIDILRGGNYGDADIFVLGDDSGQVYYTGNGVNDYARIVTFNGAEGDQIQLSGSSGDYTLGEDVPGLSRGTAIYNNDDLIGIVINVADMDLNSSDFSFV
ncbi:MAG: calcium-binding protein [Okeania sp. SIO3B5]|nr:calcium-binding protein [Okeania sp. SIO3B5]